MLKKNYALLVVAALLTASAAMAATPLGVPYAQLRQGDVSLGLDYGYAEFDGPVGTSARSNTFLANLAYGVADNVQIHGLAGIADAKGEDGFDASYDWAYGFKTKITLADQGEVKFGLATQMLWSEVDDRYTRGPLAGLKAEVDGFEIKVAPGASYEAMDNLQIYGGPMLHIVNSKESNPAYYASHNDREVGFFVGAQYEIADNISLLGEWQWTCDLDMVGVSVGYRF